LGGAAARFIVTVPGRGYRFTPSAAAPAVAAPRQGWRVGREAALETLERLIVGANEADVFVVSPIGRRKHIRTNPDLTKLDNLLSLPDCLQM
jgi:trimethylamine:corrinoid methyltransferase-like protein